MLLRHNFTSVLIAPPCCFFGDLLSSSLLHFFALSLLIATLNNCSLKHSSVHAGLQGSLGVCKPSTHAQPVPMLLPSQCAGIRLVHSYLCTYYMEETSFTYACEYAGRSSARQAGVRRAAQTASAPLSAEVIAGALCRYPRPFKQSMSTAICFFASQLVGLHQRVCF